MYCAETVDEASSFLQLLQYCSESTETVRTIRKEKRRRSTSTFTLGSWAMNDEARYNRRLYECVALSASGEMFRRWTLFLSITRLYVSVISPHCRIGHVTHYVPPSLRVHFTLFLLPGGVVLWTPAPPPHLSIFRTRLLQVSTIAVAPTSPSFIIHEAKYPWH